MKQKEPKGSFCFLIKEVLQIENKIVDLKKGRGTFSNKNKGDD